jgi:hypothetical protein
MRSVDLPVHRGLAERLQRGDRVRVVPLATNLTSLWSSNVRRFLPSEDYKWRSAPTPLSDAATLTDSDRDRLGDLNDAFRDPGVRISRRFRAPGISTASPAIVVGQLIGLESRGLGNGRTWTC